MGSTWWTRGGAADRARSDRSSRRPALAGYHPGESAGPQPYHGYYFHVLKGQGPHATGGAYDYVANGLMLGGFGLVAWPAQSGARRDDVCRQPGWWGYLPEGPGTNHADHRQGDDPVRSRYDLAEGRRAGTDRGRSRCGQRRRLSAVRRTSCEATGRMTLPASLLIEISAPRPTSRAGAGSPSSRHDGAMRWGPRRRSGSRCRLCRARCRGAAEGPWHAGARRCAYSPRGLRDG